MMTPRSPCASGSARGDGGRGQAVDVVGGGQEDVDHPGERLLRGRLALLVERALAAAPAVRDHRDAQRAELGGRVDGLLNAVGVGHVGPHEQGAVTELVRHRLALGLVEITDDDPCAGRVQPPGGRGAESAAAAGDERHCSGDVHRAPFDSRRTCVRPPSMKLS